LTESVQALLGLAMAFLFAVAPTALIFATARRVIRPRGFHPTIKLAAATVLLTLALGVVLGVEVSGGLVAHMFYVAFVSPVLALVIVGIWFIFVRRVARRKSVDGAENIK
jgi:cytochrome bd-type quinol oxidase subunit 2